MYHNIFLGKSRFVVKSKKKRKTFGRKGMSFKLTVQILNFAENEWENIAKLIVI